MTELTLQPIGVVHAPARTRVEAPRQSGVTQGVAAVIEIFPLAGFAHALEDLASWDTLWVIYWFHLNTGWRPKVLPPRSRSGRKGVFATRAPHRPNPLGLSAVRLERVDGYNLHVLDADMLDGTPVLDIKPYVAYSDARADASTGWLAPASRADPLPDWPVQFTALAAEQLAWLEAAGGPPLADRITAVLALGPEPHPYRRIRSESGGGEPGGRLAVQDWRVRFRVLGRGIEVLAIASGYRASQLTAEAAGADPGLALHRAFTARW